MSPLLAVSTMIGHGIRHKLTTLFRSRDFLSVLLPAGLVGWSTVPCSVTTAGETRRCLGFPGEERCVLWGMYAGLMHSHSLCTCQTLAGLAAAHVLVSVPWGYTGYAWALTSDISWEHRCTDAETKRHLLFSRTWNSSDASLQQSDKFFPEVSLRLCNPPPTLSKHKHNGIVTDSLNTKWIAFAVLLVVWSQKFMREPWDFFSPTAYSKSICPF